MMGWSFTQAAAGIGVGVGGADVSVRTGSLTTVAGAGWQDRMEKASSMLGNKIRNVFITPRIIPIEHARWQLKNAAFTMCGSRDKRHNHRSAACFRVEIPVHLAFYHRLRFFASSAFNELTQMVFGISKKVVRLTHEHKALG